MKLKLSVSNMFFRLTLQLLRLKKSTTHAAYVTTPQIWSMKFSMSSFTLQNFEEYNEFELEMQL